MKRLKLYTRFTCREFFFVVLQRRERSDRYSHTLSRMFTDARIKYRFVKLVLSTHLLSEVSYGALWKYGSRMEVWYIVWYGI